jgi:pimeloyl-ACP methyl ester carboxylesterase
MSAQVLLYWLVYAVVHINRLQESARVTETVVLVHGVWMTGLEMSLLALRLRRCGYRTVQFRYRSLRHPVAHNAQRLCKRIGEQGDTRVHIVAHSLGGIVSLQALQDQPDLISGHIVLLGSPVNGSVIAQRVNRHGLIRWSIGRSGEGGLLGGGPRWHGKQDLGVIAGTRPFGVGTFLGGFDGPNDGTVAVEETRLEHVTAGTTFHSSHFGMLYSGRVAAAVCSFLDHGYFDPAGE